MGVMGKRVQTLEERVEKLEARLKELEGDRPGNSPAPAKAVKAAVAAQNR